MLTALRVDSTTRSPLYTIYGESITGVSVLRAFGASTKFLVEMHRHVDTVCLSFCDIYHKLTYHSDSEQ